MQRKPTKKGANEQTAASMSDEQLQQAISDHGKLIREHGDRLSAISNPTSRELYLLIEEQCALATRQCELITESSNRILHPKTAPPMPEIYTNEDYHYFMNRLREVDEMLHTFRTSMRNSPGYNLQNTCILGILEYNKKRHELLRKIQLCDKPSEKRKKTIHLICTNPGDGTGLEYLQRYTTSSGLRVGEYGCLCYSINEMEGDLKKSERFVISKPPKK